MKDKPKILLLWERMGDYHRARWRELSLLAGKDNVIAVDYGMGDGLYQWDNTKDENHFCLSQKQVGQVSTFEAFNAFRRLVKGRGVSLVCIPGYGRPAYILMMLWSRMKGIRVLMFAESWYPSGKLTDVLKGFMIRMCADVCFVSGKHAAEHFTKRLNFPASRTLVGYSVVDNKHFAGTGYTNQQQDKPQLLCVARHAPEKNLELLIEAFKKSHLSQKWQLRIVGGGPEKKHLETLINDADIRLDNWLSYDQLPKMYQSATCFILPSRFEPWGLVVNEAMAAGLPVILSDQVGALPDLLTEENGWHFKQDSEEECIECLNRLSNTSTETLSEMGNKSQQKIRQYTPETWARTVFNLMKNDI